MTLFMLSSEESEILYYLEQSKNLREVAEKSQRDLSVISRRLKFIHSKTQFLTKSDKQWRLTPSGLLYNEWTKRVLLEQDRVLKMNDVLRIITTREFSNRMIATQKLDFSKNFESIEILTNDSGIEADLLDRKAQIGFDCGKPYSPIIRHKRGPIENYSIIAHPKVKAKRVEDLQHQDHILYFRMPMHVIEDPLGFKVKIKASYSDIGSVREHLLHQGGWAILPDYAVKAEVESKKLVKLFPKIKIEPTFFNLMWNSENPPAPQLLDSAFQWLCKQKL